jgi:hypothetical protein
LHDHMILGRFFGGTYVQNYEICHEDHGVGLPLEAWSVTLPHALGVWPGGWRFLFETPVNFFRGACISGGS